MALRHLDVMWRLSLSGANSMNRLRGAVAVVFVIVPQWPPRFHRDRCGHHRAFEVAWPGIDGKYVFHRRYEGGNGRGRDDPVKPTTLFSNNRSVQRVRPLCGFEQASTISLAYSPSKIWSLRCLALFAIQNRLEPFLSTQLPAHAVEIEPLASKAAMILL
jgi:hypothetical protein